MEKVKKALRLLFLALLLILAAFGIGLTGNFLNNNRERFMNNEIRTEIVEKKEETEDKDQEKP